MNGLPKPHDPKESIRNYRVCRETFNQFSWASYGDDWGPAMRNLFFNIVNAKDPKRNLHDPAFARAAKDGLLEKAEVLRGIFQPISDRHNEEEVFRDVYEAATYVTLSIGGFWQQNPLQPRYFRGQKRDWPVIPAIQRNCKDFDCVAAAIARLTKFVRAIQRTRNITDEQAVAVAQHYSSKENGLSTWLLDVTRDPLVALFFASRRGSKNEKDENKYHGLVWAISEGEWDRLAGGGSNLLGAIRPVTVPDIHRILVQKGLFIDTSHPELFDQYVPHTIRFQQIENLVFEDDQLEIPITSEFLLQDDTRIESVIQESTNFAAEPPLTLLHPVHPPRKLTGQDYFEIVVSWARNNPQWEITRDDETILIQLCDFHAELQDLAADLAGNKDLSYGLTPLRSLHNLWRGVDLVLKFPQPRGNLLQLNYLNRTGNLDLRKRMSEAAEKVITRWV